VSARSSRPRIARLAPLAANRRGDLDWLRLALLLLAFAVWSLRSWSVPQPHPDDWATVLNTGNVPAGFDLWVLGLFLLVSGASLRREAREYDPGTFLLRRVLRLFVPFVAGMLAFALPQTYLEMVLARGRPVSVPQFVGDALGGTGAVESGASVALHGFHLAYLPLLWIMSLASVPLLRASRRWTGNPGPVGRGVRVAAIAAVPACLAIPGPAGALAAAPLALFCGYVLVDGGKAEAFWRLASPRILFGAVAGTIAAIDLPEPVGSLARSLGVWVITVSALGVALPLLSRLHPPPAVLREASLPFYILSRPVTVLLAFLIRNVELPNPLRRLMVTAAAAAVLLGAALLARRVPLLRFLVGLGAARGPETRGTRPAPPEHPRGARQ
jgi:hypothetical protein